MTFNFPSYWSWFPTYFHFSSGWSSAYLKFTTQATSTSSEDDFNISSNWPWFQYKLTLTSSQSQIDLDFNSSSTYNNLSLNLLQSHLKLILISIRLPSLLLKLIWTSPRIDFLLGPRSNPILTSPEIDLDFNANWLWAHLKPWSQFKLTLTPCQTDLAWSQTILHFNPYFSIHFCLHRCAAMCDRNYWQVYRKFTLSNVSLNPNCVKECNPHRWSLGLLITWHFMKACIACMQLSSW